MQAMMQQMMSNPAMMQQSMQMAQSMFGNQGAGAGAGFPAMFGQPALAPTSPVTEGGEQDANAPTPDVDAFARLRFAAQLAQLSAMGFCNEAAALRALQRHQGRVDAAIDTLLSEGSS